LLGPHAAAIQLISKVCWDLTRLFVCTCFC
jgi:hypothetical protein